MRYFVIAMFVLSPILFMACSQQSPADEAASRQARLQDAATRLLNSTVYFRDDRAQPPVCYAYLPASGRIGVPGGPALAAVPCEAVERLLIGR